MPSEACQSEQFFIWPFWCLYCKVVKGQEDLPAWLFKATLVDTLHLPAGTQGSDLLADATFREFVRNLFSWWALVLPMIHIPPSAFKLENATVLEDVYSEAINAHGGVGHGKKSVRFEAVVTVSSRPVSALSIGLVLQHEDLWWTRWFQRDLLGTVCSICEVFQQGKLLMNHRRIMKLSGRFTTFQSVADFYLDA